MDYNQMKKLINQKYDVYNIPEGKEFTIKVTSKELKRIVSALKTAYTNLLNNHKRNHSIFNLELIDLKFIEP